MKFKKLTGPPDFELAPYVNQIVERNKGLDMQIYLGCDSQNKALKTVYATTIVFHIASTGCHVIYKKEEVPVIRDMWTRLWKETEKSCEVALYLREYGIEVSTIWLTYGANSKSGGPVSFLNFIDGLLEINTFIIYLLEDYA